ncbi:hypothetical protein ACFPRL_10490 [Pseudoclavibacter helvolus]
MVAGEEAVRLKRRRMPWPVAVEHERRVAVARENQRGLQPRGAAPDDNDVVVRSQRLSHAVLPESRARQLGRTGIH